MADSKSLEQLKANRTTVKRQFSRLANNVVRMCTILSEEELRDSFKQLTTEANKVMEANDDVEAQYIAEVKLDADVSVLSDQQKADIEKTASECEVKLKAVKDLIQETLWASFGEEDLIMAVKAVEDEVQCVASIKPSGNQEVFDFMLDHLERLVKTAKELYIKWKCWAPPAEKKDFQHRIRGLEQVLLKLISRKTDFIHVRVKEEARNVVSAASISSIPVIKLKPTSLPKFTGIKRDFYRWRRDWETLQKQVEPTGSKEVKKFQLLDSLDEKITRDFRLMSYNTADEIFRVLENRFGSQTAIAIEIVEEIQKLPAVKGYQPKRIVELIQAVEKALQDLSDLGDTGAIKNPLVTKSIESKLPDALKEEWLLHAAEKSTAVGPDKRFDSLLAFLKSQEDIYEQLDQLKDEDASRREIKTESRQARTRASNQSSSHLSGCVVCGDNKHKEKLYFCKKFCMLKLTEKKDAVRRLGACRKCLEIHDGDDHCKTSFLCKSPQCKQATDHHYYLCPYRRNYTEAQEEFFRKLSPELAQQCQDVFCNTVSRAFNTARIESGLLAENGLVEWPIIMMLLNVKANAGQNIEITLVVHGVRGMKVFVKTKRYLLKILVRMSTSTIKSHQLVTANKLQKFFPDVPLDELARPREIHLLISHKEGQLAPQKICSVGDLVLWDGPLGKTVAGTHPDLFEEIAVSAHMSRTHFARSMRTAAVKYEELTCVVPRQLPLSQQTSLTIQPQQFSSAATTHDFLEWWRWDSIGAACEPRCGGCRCGNCHPGGKDMTLAEERELEVVRSCLTYAVSDDHNERPHWHARYPLIEDLATLPNNRKAVESTFLRTERQLAKELEWKATYAAQVHDMVNRRAAMKLSKEALLTWSGPVWYISHLIAPNPHSVTTPVRLIWNSSQKFRGLSLNDLLLKGPDVLNLIRTVLLKFRRGVFAALGDIKKMYNSVWLEDKEVHLHRFLWRDSEEEELGEYAITRVNIGDKPAGCIAQLAMRETANLSQFSHLREECRVLQEDSYVDDILTSCNNLDQLKILAVNVEQILKAGGFELKPWVFSGQSRKESVGEKEKIPKTVVLPNQLKDEDNKALSLGYILEEDKLHVMVRINSSRRKKKIRLGQDLLLEQVRTQTPDPLTRRELLSQVSGLYDPIGLTTPVKQRGAILVRRAFQEAKPKRSAIKDTWDFALSNKLREDAIEEYVHLGKVKFARALTPTDYSDEPNAITFSDGSEHAYGAVLYLWWACDQGSTVRLVESKAKLTPLEHKGEVVKAELCGAVFAAHLKMYFDRYSQIQVKQWYHLVDSQTVLGAIQRESYGFQTFFANRIGEIQNSTRLQDWWWVPGSLNIADIITQGTGSKDLDEDLEWQRGPKFLSLPVDEWPIKSAKDVVVAARESISKMQKKSFAAALTRAQVNKRPPDQEPRRPPAGTVIRNLVDEERFSNLTHLVKTVSWVWRAAKKFAAQNRTLGIPKWEAVPLPGVQQNFTEIQSLICSFAVEESRASERIKLVFPSYFIVRGFRHCWLERLTMRVMSEWLQLMRKKAWVIKGRRIAQKVVDNCVICKKGRARRCQQVMGSLPQERTRPAAQFEFTAVDLFGPYHVKDDVKKRVTMKVWGVVFCCMVSRAIHTDLVNTMSTESFLMVSQRFTAIRGHPKKIWSDPGSNFIGAKSSVVEEASAKNGTDWQWKLQPADSPHRNGAAEAAVRIVKKAFQSLGKESGLSYSELQTTFQIAANLANERPIDAKVQSREDGVQYITPNTLLLGRASSSGDFKVFDFVNYPYKRLQEMQCQVNRFWRSWSQLAGPNLFVRSKWHTLQRNVTVGDIVWLCEMH
ncbi:gag-pol fusion polyprotein [Triplophysa rosa]|uniref:Gag-pol fusion polyprotein n=1 Tax=Triplophysa rosa TaxID=992332 RepID=A0A9W7T844_TRIRA|nr:gag-pol fusion polyprotein [Triplophysa rosa]